MSLTQKEMEWVSFREGDLKSLDREEETEDNNSSDLPEILAFKVQHHSQLPTLKLRQIIEPVFIDYCNKFPLFAKVFGNFVPTIAVLKKCNFW